MYAYNIIVIIIMITIIIIMIMIMMITGGRHPPIITHFSTKPLILGIGASKVLPIYCNMLHYNNTYINNNDNNDNNNSYIHNNNNS